VIQRAALGANSQAAAIPIRNFVLSTTPRRALGADLHPGAQAASPAPKLRTPIHLGTMTASGALGMTRTAPGPFVGCKTVAFLNNRSIPCPYSSDSGHSFGCLSIYSLPIQRHVNQRFVERAP
jgi:hypothetical protein